MKKESSEIRFQVFPGIELLFKSVYGTEEEKKITEDTGNKIEIDYCRKGRLECQTGGRFFYLTPGGVILHRIGEMVREEVLPTGHYEGITVRMDLDRTPKCLSCFLEDVAVEPAYLARRFSLEEKLFFSLKRTPAIEHVFSELADVPVAIQKGYFKVKILELFLLLSTMEPEESRAEQKLFCNVQVELAKKISNYLDRHLDEDVTVKSLSEEFGSSVSQIKYNFQMVYGTSVSDYLREQRMHQAAEVLCSTDRTVLDIAGQFGYENGSKFAAAFRRTMGTSPAEFRKQPFSKRS